MIPSFEQIFGTTNVSPFEQLFDALDLWKNGRKNAAKAQWDLLPEDFRKKVIDITIKALEFPLPITWTSAKIRSKKFGDFIIDNKHVNMMTTYVPQILGV